MIKKISAILLALVLCLSVVVVPVSAMELGDAVIGYEIKFDKEYYNPGDTAVVSVYVNAAEGYELGTFMITIGFQSSVFAQADNVADDIKASAVSNDAYQMLYADITNANIGWAAAGQVTGITNANTDEEKALYDEYITIQGSRDSASSITNKNGLPTADLNADTAPFIQFSLTVSADVAEGTAVSAAVTTGSISRNRTYFNYYKNPGNATTIAKMSTLGDSLIVAGTSTIGEPAAPSPLVATTSQIRYQMTADGAYNNAVDVRTRATITKANWDTIFGGKTDAEIEAESEAGNFSAGFVYVENSVEFSAANAQQVAQGTAVSGYTNKPVSHIQATADGYIFTCLVTDITEANLVAGDGMTAYAYMQVGDTWYFYDAATTVLFKDLYNEYYDDANGAFGWSLTTIA